MKLQIEHATIDLDREDLMSLLGWLTGQSCRNDEVLTYLKELKMELQAQLEVIANNLTEASAEIVAKIAELEAALANATISEQAQALLDDIAAKAEALADIVPDVPPAEDTIEGTGP